jgi:hypothetical protein
MSGDPEAQVHGRQSQAPPPGRAWYQLRWQVLLLVPLALLLLAAFYVPRQLRQQRAIETFKRLNVVVRTQPVALFGLELVLPQEYADEIVEVYWRDPALDENQLAALHGLSTVEKLELSGSRVTSAGLQHLAGLSKLYMLHLDGTQVGDDGLTHLSRLRSLGVLSLDNSKVTDAGLGHLRRMPQLERVYLNGTPITDAGLLHLAGLKNLKELSLVETQVSDAGLVHLKELKNLEMLKVHNTRVTQAGMDELHAALPKCVIWLPSQ